jgi:hypothetical protein
VAGVVAAVVATGTSGADERPDTVLAASRGPRAASEAGGLDLLAAGDAEAIVDPAAPGAEPEEALPAGGRRASEADPLRVLVTGDSVAFDLAGPLVWALNAGGQVEAEFVLDPSLARDEVARVLWQQRVESLDPGVIVVLMGTWESFLAVGEAEDAGTSVFAPDWVRLYRAAVVEPWLEAVTVAGAEVVWVGQPAAADWGRSLQFARLNDAYAAVAGDWTQVTFVDGAAVLTGPRGPFTDVGEDAFGRPVRWRNLDGLHLCADGAVRLAEPVIQTLQDRWEVRVGPGWRQGDWRLQVGYPPEECPPPAPA